MNDLEFDKASRESAQAIVSAVEARLHSMVNGEVDMDIPDAIKVFEAMHKRLGSFQQEKQDSQMVVHWNISGGNVTIGVEKAPDVPAITADVTDVEAKETIEPTPTFSLNLGKVEITDDLLE